MKSSKILITGAGGFLGRELTSTLQKELPSHSDLYPLTRRDCDLEDAEAVQQILERIQPDFVFHFSGISKVSASIPVADYFRANVLQTQHLIQGLEALQKSVKFCLASSVHVYGDQQGLIDESAFPHPRSNYAFSKFLAEESLKKASKSTSFIEGLVVRLSSCLGPGQSEGFVASDINRKIRTAQKNPSPSISMGPLGATRHFTDCRDVARALFTLALKKQQTSFEVFNLAAPNNVSVEALLNTFIKVSNSKVTINTEASQDNPFLGLQISTAKFREKAPDFEFRTLEETVRDIWCFS